MSKSKVSDDDIVFRDLDGTVDSGENKEKEQEDDSKKDEFGYEVVNDEDDEEDEDDKDDEEVEEEGDTDEEGDDDDDDEEEDDEDSALKNFTPEVRKRIERERRLKREAIENSNSELTKIREELKQAKTERLRSDYTAIKSMSKSCELDLANARRDLIEAKESGDTEKEVEAQSKFNELQAVKRQIAGELTRIESEAEKLDKEQADTTASDTKRAAQTNGDMTPEAQRWIKRNDAMFKKLTEQQRGFLMSIDGRIGGNPNSPEYFDKINSLLKAAYPELSPKGSRESKIAKKKELSKGKRSLVAGVNADSTAARTQGNNSGNKNKVIITSADQKAMRTFGLDPTNKSHLAEWAREKRSMKD